MSKDSDDHVSAGTSKVPLFHAPFLSRASRRKKKWRHTPGTPPGTLISDPSALPPRIHLMAYGPEGYVEEDNISLADFDLRAQGFAVTWIIVEGLGDASLLAELGNRYELHQLSLEDILSSTHRSKAEAFDDTLFVIVHSADPQLAEGSRQISHFLRQNIVLSFMDSPDPGIGAIRARVRSGKGRIRRMKADYLLYALVDVAIDSYFPIIDKFGEHLDALEERIILSPQTCSVAEPHAAKRELLDLRKVIWPLREVVSDIERYGQHVMTEESLMFLRDCHDHAIQLIDLVETYREIASGLFDSYLTTMSNRLNETIRILTIISTIFIPLSFVASLYGMNFNTRTSHFNMPELEWAFGYPAVLSLMAVIGLSMLLYFYRKGWIWTKKYAPPSPSERNGNGAKKERPPI